MITPSFVSDVFPQWEMKISTSNYRMFQIQSNPIRINVIIMWNFIHFFKFSKMDLHFMYIDFVGE